MNILDNSIGPSFKTLKVTVMYGRDVQPNFSQEGRRSLDDTLRYIWGRGPKFLAVPQTLIDR